MNFFNSEWLNFITNFIAIPVAVIIFLYKGFRKILYKKIDHYFREKITLFKHQLDLTAEAEKFNYQRKIQDFSLYTTKKHEKYIKIYEFALETKSKIYNFHIGTESKENKLRSISDSFTNFKNYYDSSKLYLTNSIDKKLNELLNIFTLMVTSYQSSEFFTSDDKRNLENRTIDVNKILGEIEDQLSELTILLKGELSVGYYKE